MASSLYIFTFIKSMHFLFFFFFFFCFFNWFHLSIATPNAFSKSLQPPCHADESSALLQFKQALSFNESASDDPLAYQKLQSWKIHGETGDCCLWDGVECDQSTGHVVGLDLSSSFLFGSINSNSCLFSLVHLRKLNLADNDFNYSQIPSEISHLLQLTTLNLSLSAFSGQIPSEISKLSKLVSLDLSRSSGLLRFGKLGFRRLLENLTNLEVLRLSEVNISSRVILPNMSSLTALRLRDCGLYGMFPTSIFHLPKLQLLNLRDNEYLTGHFPKFDHNTLFKGLDFSNTSFSGKLPRSIGNLTSLDYLYLSESNFSGSLPDSLGNLTQLSYLHLGSNNFSGHIPSLAGLSELQTLSLYSNEFEVGSLFWLLNLTNLNELDLSGLDLHGSFLFNSEGNQTKDAPVGLFDNTIVMNLQILQLQSCNLKEFPYFLRFQHQLRGLSLTNNKIHGVFPAWMLNISTETLQHLSLLQNYLTSFEQHPAILPWKKLRVLLLGNNNLQGRLPIPPASTLIYSIKGNKLTGKVPPLICTLSSLYILDLSNNSLRGFLPPCLSNFSDSLKILNFGGNNFNGPIPQTYIKGNKLELISFAQSKLQGKLPRSLGNCTMLKVLDISNNQIEDTFPLWLGALTELQILNLHSNKFYGAIRTHKTKFELPNLRIIDFSHNGFSGHLPTKFFCSWSAMKYLDIDSLKKMIPTIKIEAQDLWWQYEYIYTMTITNKGVDREYAETLDIFTGIDLSSNKFEGGIPKSLGDLMALQLLNLSNNELSDGIPSAFGDLSNLEALDLAWNKLSGEIPQQLSQLTFLGFFNVSHNNLTGRVPRGTQFDTFQTNSYEGNPGLCSDLLPRKCGELEALPPRPASNSDGSENSAFPSTVVDWVIISMGFGSGMVVGIVMGQMLTSKYHEWFMETFGRKKTNQRRERRRSRGRGN